MADEAYVPDSGLVGAFWALFERNPLPTKDQLTDQELRALIACAGWLSDDDRAHFQIKRADLLPQELAMYSGPHNHLLERYFPE